MTRKKDPNSRSGQIRAAIKLFPGHRNRDIADLTGESENLISKVRSTMYRRKPRKPNVVDAAIEPMAMSLPAPEQAQDANAIQVGGQHYKSKAIQPWDYIASNNLGYLEGNVVKYVSRWKDKGGVEDLKKAQHYLAKLIEVNE